MRKLTKATAIVLAVLLCVENLSADVSVLASEGVEVVESQSVGSEKVILETEEESETEDESETEEKFEDESVLNTENEELSEVAQIQDGDPQSGTSMSNGEVEPEYLNVMSLYQQSGYTGNTYLHNSRFDTGYRIVNGIDVSSHNGTINWASVKASGVEYAIIRAGYRTLQSGTLGEDANFRTNIQGALNAGLKVGVYIFSQAITQAEAVDEANYIMSLISGYNVTLPVVIDYEYGANHTGRLADAKLNIDTQTAICNAFCSTVASAGYTPMIYANKSMLQSDIRGDVLDDYYKIWLANYTTQTTYAGNYYAWQYSSAGFVNGISGYVDCNFFYEKTNYENAAKYVTRLYQNLLGREPDTAGLSAYANAIANGQLTACDVAVQIVESTEFVNKGYSNSAYVTKVYEALLIRTPGDSEITYWTTHLSNGVSKKYILAQIAGSSEFALKCSYYGIAQGTVTLTENRDKNYNATAYVMRCYQNILGRNADVSGLNTWSGKLLNGYGGAEIVKDLVVSKEFQNQKKTDSEFLDIIYKSMLGRNADPAGRASWMSNLEQGVSYVYIINGFAGSAEFTNICTNYGIKAGRAAITEERDRNIGVTGFVNRCYKKALGRNGEAAGINNWCAVILNGAQTPQQIAYGFVFSQEAANKKLSNEQFVEMLYGLCLDRTSDSAGKADWVGQLNRGVSRETVFWGFANSEEFQQIVKSYGL